VSHVEAARAAQRLLPTSQYFEVRYERLHSEGPQVMRTLAEWLGITWSEDELRDALQRNSPEAARAGGGTAIPLGGEFGKDGRRTVTEPPGFIRQARAGTWRHDLSAVDKFAVWRVAHATMAEVGYPWKAPWST
jgi:hypothetical protein